MATRWLFTVVALSMLVLSGCTSSDAPTESRAPKSAARGDFVGQAALLPAPASAPTSISVEVPAASAAAELVSSGAMLDRGVAVSQGEYAGWFPSTETSSPEDFRVWALIPSASLEGHPSSLWPALHPDGGVLVVAADTKSQKAYAFHLFLDIAGGYWLVSPERSELLMNRLTYGRGLGAPREDDVRSILRSDGVGFLVLRQGEASAAVSVYRVDGEINPDLTLLGEAIGYGALLPEESVYAPFLDRP